MKTFDRRSRSSGAKSGWSGIPAASNAEGELAWVPIARVLAACSNDDIERAGANLPMWDGDRYFLPLIFDDDLRVFHGVMPYVNGRPTSWNYERW